MSEQQKCSIKGCEQQASCIMYEVEDRPLEAPAPYCDGHCEHAQDLTTCAFIEDLPDEDDDGDYCDHGKRSDEDCNACEHDRLSDGETDGARI